LLYNLFSGKRNFKFYKNIEKIKIMAAAYLPAILVPLVGIVFPGLSMAFLFLYIEKDEIN
jgi:photosystem I subunit 8